MLGELIPTGGGDPIPLLKAKLLIGRRDECDITLRFPNVSSHHCELELIDGYWQIRDLKSSNGIKVNGTRCPQNWLLPSDEVSIANHRFEIKYTAVGPAPTPMNAFDASVSLMEKAGMTGRGGSGEGGEDISQSLMEKAGLERRPPPTKRPATIRPADTPPQGSKKPESDESLALKWLESDE
ncbi:MAG: FHA domain-containing protein [Planctomycetota bacterium]